MDTASFMLEALSESKKALPNCLPNPPVGCVIVRNNRIVARGFTQRPGQAHAEIDAMSKVEGSLADCELYVTLEPCSFHGRTPACADALLRRDVKTLYVALIDTHEKNHGRGIRILEEGGVNVEVGLQENVVGAFLKPYLLD